MTPVKRNVLAVLALVAVSLASALLVVALAWDRDGAADEQAATFPATPVPDDQPSPPTAGPVDELPPIRTRASLDPQTVLFGDVVRARVETVVDSTRVDPDSVRVAAEFKPWQVLGDPERTRRDVGSTAYLRTVWTLRCLTGPCVPSGQVAPLEFDNARVTFVIPADGDVRQTMPTPWPVLAVYSRFAAAAFERDNSATVWRADLLTVPLATYRIAPGALYLILLGAGAFFAIAGIALVVLAWPRRKQAPPPEPVVVLPPRLTPLQQALALLEDVNRADGAADRRRSLELVAEALGEWGDPDLSRTARILAWSEHAPAAEETSDLAARVRSTLDFELEAHEQMGNGRVV